MISVLILTLNEETNLTPLLHCLARFDDIHVLDSGSADRTVHIAREHGAHVATRCMDDWSSQLNWALANLPFAHDFIFQIDADERPTPELVKAMFGAVQSPEDHVAFCMPRHDFFMGRRLKHVQSTPSYIRLYKPRQVHFSRLVNPVTHVRGSVGRLDAPLLHQPFSKGLGHWFARHNQYAFLEAREILHSKGSDYFAPKLTTALFGKTVQKRRRHQKALYQRLPARPLVKFVWLYVVKKGFLDGRPGLAYALLQFFYEWMIVFHVWEGRLKCSPKSTEGL